MDGAMHRIRFLNPRTDEAFVRHVEAVVAGGAESAAELEARLRESYPAAVVRERDLSGEPGPIWYVYRDGRWEPSDEPAAPSSTLEDDLRATAEGVKGDAERIVEIESQKERIASDDAQRVALATEATDLAARVVEGARIEEALAREALDDERSTRPSPDGDEG